MIFLPPPLYQSLLSVTSLALLTTSSLHADPRQSSAASTASGSVPVGEETRSKSSSIELGGKRLQYVTTTGKLVITDASNQPMAELFYIAYTKDGAKAGERPVTFLWDGGPGGCSLAGNVLGMGPRHYLPQAGETLSTPYTLKDNAHSILAYSDLIYFDPVGTGYSRALGNYQDSDFWGLHSDANLTTLAIERYLKLNQRWESPKFIGGVSYGTSRAAMVSHLAQLKGIGLDGVILIASALNFGMQSYGMDQEAVTNLPSFAAIAWKHGKGAHTGQKLPEVISSVKEFIRTEYGPALFEGNTLSEERREAIAEKLSGFTGLSKSYLLRANLRVSVVRFRKELLRDEGLAVGRMDGRIKNVEQDTAGEEPEGDAWVFTNYVIPATALFQQLISDELDYRPAQHYVFVSPNAAAKWNWSYTPPATSGISRSELQDSNIFPPNAWPAGHLAAAMRADNNLQVYQANAYYDLATPFAWAEYDLAHMLYSPKLIANIHQHYYEAGHGIFMDGPSLKKMYEDLGEFYQKALAKDAKGVINAKENLE